MRGTFAKELAEDPVSYYDRNAERLSRQYESLTFEQVHGDVIQFLPEPPARVLEVGAGSGRDAAALVKKYYHVVAVEPSPALRRIGQKIHRLANLTWVDDRLPHLKNIESSACFDVIFCSALWMHLTRMEKVTAMRRLSHLSCPNARIFISFRTILRDDPPFVHKTSAAELIADAVACRFQLIKQTNSPDWCGRTSVIWHSLVFEKIETAHTPETE